MDVVPSWVIDWCTQIVDWCSHLLCYVYATKFQILKIVMVFQDTFWGLLERFLMASNKILHVSQDQLFGSYFSPNTFGLHFGLEFCNSLRKSEKISQIGALDPPEIECYGTPIRQF